MDDKLIVRRLLEMGIAARQSGVDAYARPADDPDLQQIGPAAIAHWLGEFGRHQLVGDVQPCFTGSGAGFEFRVTDTAVDLLSESSRFDAWLDDLFPSPPEFDVFISYAKGDAAIAEELRADLVRSGLTCFMAEKDIGVATKWEDSIRAALRGSERVLVLLSPRSVDRPWVLMETGAAWVLGKPLIPALSHVAASELRGPIKSYNARPIETTAQRQSLVDELAGT